MGFLLFWGHKIMMHLTFDENTAEKFLKLKMETDFDVQEGQRVLNKMNSKRPTARHIIKMEKKLK